MAKSLKVANQCLILQINVPGVAETRTHSDEENLNSELIPKVI